MNLDVREDRSGREVIELDELGDAIVDLRTVCQQLPAGDVAERHLSKMEDAALRAASPDALAQRQLLLGPRTAPPADRRGPARRSADSCRRSGVGGSRAFPSGGGIEETRIDGNGGEEGCSTNVASEEDRRR
jgi:hypothetical protein